ncbi:MAG: cell envelope integrity protein TolA [Gammaproteobacteria bacterium]|nr:cell envelope integrity protein TolA [Gammaproteobacteria bacterium]
MSSGLVGDIRRYPSAMAAAVVLHVVIVAALAINFTRDARPVAVSAVPPVNIVKAEAIDAKQFDEALRKHQQAEDKKRQQALDAKRRKEEARKKAAAEKQRKAEEQKRIALQKKQEEEKRQKAAAEKKRAEEKRKAAEEKKRQEAEARRKAEAKAEQERMAAILAAEEAEIKEQERIQAERIAAAEQARYSRELDRLRVGYIAMITAHVQSRWIRPPSAQPGDIARVYINQAPGGFIINVRLVSCNGSAAFCQSVEAAVRKSDPLPQPENPDLFEREIEFIFKPLGD